MKSEFRWRHELVTRHLVAAGALAAPPQDMLTWLRDRHACLIAPQPVIDLHLDRLPALQQTAAKWTLIPVADGEEAKSIDQAEAVWRRLSEAGVGRDARLLALGGGATTDLVGFVAATYLRGVEFALLPTTTLAQIDAAVGAKSGVNLGGIKNVVGAFAPPAWVIADPEVLATEGPRQRAAGLVEALKLACVDDAELFECMESDWERLLDGESAVLEAVIGRAVEAKLDVVGRDPDERDLRRVLNFGHTLGHALESVDGGATLLHGEAVAWGVLFALHLSCSRGVLAPEAAARVAALLRRLELPRLPEVAVETLLEAMSRDKKQTRQGLVWVLMSGIGEHRLDAGVDEGEVRLALGAFLADPWRQSSGAGESA